MPILLTGTSGYLGSLLHKAFSDRPVIKLRFDISESHYNWDNSNLDICYQSEDFTIIHAGALTPKSQKELNSRDDYSLNTISTIKLLEILPKPPKRILYLSTADVYVSSTDFINEFTSPIPHNAYTKSKIASEDLIRSYAQSKGCESVLLRIGSVFGPNNLNYRKAIEVMINDAMTKGVIELVGTGNERRPFVFEDDLISQIVHLEGKECLPEVINLVGDKDRTVNQVLETILKRFPQTSIRRNHNSVFQGSIFDERQFNRKVFWQVLPDFVFSDFEESIGRTIDAQFAQHYLGS